VVHRKAYARRRKITKADWNPERAGAVRCVLQFRSLKAKFRRFSGFRRFIMRLLATIAAAALLVLGSATIASAQDSRPAAAKPNVSGTFKGNGKDARIAFVTARWREPFSGKPGIRLIFTERDHSKDAKPDFNAGFGRFGSALVISTHEDGGIFGCEVAHSAHQGTFSSIGTIKLVDFKVENGIVSGQLTTGGQADFFRDTWEVDLKFAAPLLGTRIEAESEKPSVPSSDTPRPASPKVAKKGADRKPASSADDPAAPAGPKLNVKDLALPETATEIEYKKLVKHITFKCPGGVQAVAADITKRFGDQGWTKAGPGPELITAKSAILKRKRGEAELTIIVNAEGSGSLVKIFSEGLDWEGK
jgi:hypothetical protein